MSGERLLTTRELADALALTRQRVARLAAAARIPTAGWLKGRRMFCLADCRAALAPVSESASDLLTVNELARELRRSQNTVRAWVTTGALVCAGTRMLRGAAVMGFRLSDAVALSEAKGREKGRPGTPTAAGEPARKPATRACNAEPGSAARQREYARRVEAGEELFAPGDVTLAVEWAQMARQAG